MPSTGTAPPGRVRRIGSAGSGRFADVPDDAPHPSDGDPRTPDGESSHPGSPGAGDEQVENVQVHEIGSRRYVIADVEPLDVDGVRTVAVGTGLWLLAFVLLLPFYGRLEESGRLDWLWTCVAGFGLGIIGWDHCRRRRRAAARTSPDRPR